MQVWPISAASSLLHYVKRCHCTFFVCLIQNLNPWLRLSTTWMLKAETYLRLAPHSAWGSSTLHISVPAELFDPVGQHSKHSVDSYKKCPCVWYSCSPHSCPCLGQNCHLVRSNVGSWQSPRETRSSWNLCVYIYIYIFTLYMYILCMYTYECISNSCLLYLDIEVGQASELPLMKRAKKFNLDLPWRKEWADIRTVWFLLMWQLSHPTNQYPTLSYTGPHTKHLAKIGERHETFLSPLTFFLTQESKASDTETQWPTA